MTATAPTTPNGRKRRTRVRTRSVSTRPALHLSALPPAHVDLHPEAKAKSVVCPDCQTWCPIAGAQGAAPKLPPHHTAPASQDDTAQEDGPTAHRCIGSNRRVVLDVTTAEWLRQYARATENGCAPEARRGTTLIKRPSASAPAVTQMRPVPVASPAQAAHRAAQEELARHRSRCSRCQPRQHGQTSNPCVQGALLRLRAITAQRAYVSASTPA